MNVQTLTMFFAVLSLGCLAGSAVLVLVLVLRRLGFWPDWLDRVWFDLGNAALGLAFAVAATAMAGSLYYSEHVGYVPCKLCWYQRICMYSLAVILLVATIRRDRLVRFYVLPLAGIGAVVAAYHTWVQAYPPPSGTSFCTADASCTARYVWEFGFVSLPLMALSGFLFVIAMMLLAWDAAPDAMTPDDGTDSRPTDGLDNALQIDTTERR